MTDFFNSLLQKIDDFLFEALGLILPSMMFVIILFQPFLYISCLDNNKMLKFSEILFKSLSDSYSFWLVIIIIFTFYVFGNVIKVLSKMYYDFGNAIFDNTIFKGIKYLHGKVFKNKKAKFKLKNMIFISIVYVPYKWLKDTLSFRTINYGYDFRELYIDLAKNKLNIKDFDPDKNWYYFYKEATNMLNNSNVKNLYYKFLSKYNSFRSIEFVFAFSIIYNLIIAFLNGITSSTYCLVLIFNFLCLLSFHDKYKRYWMLCGNEVITGLHNLYKQKENNDEK